jgi:hypothetical protein
MHNLAAITIAAALASSTPAGAEPVATAAETGWRFSVGVSPALALLKGGGIEVDVMPPGHLRFFASAFTLAIPKLFQRSNSDEGWTIRDTGAGVGIEYFLRATGRGVFFGAIIEVQNHHDERMGLSQDTLELGVAAEIGYRWMPWRNLYITPRLLAVVPLYQNNERTLGGETLDEAPVRPVPLVYAGWEF